jgi:hypothetical protein
MGKRKLWLLEAEMEGYEFEARLVCVVEPCLKKKTKPKTINKKEKYG